MSKNYTNKELFKIWGKVAANSFGGPAGQISVIHQLVVDQKKIVDEKRFLHALNFCMLLPGPEAQQLATYMGWIMAGVRGGLIAGGLFILPGFLSILLLSYVYVIYQDIPIIDSIFYGIKPAIISIVLGALFRMSKKSLHEKFNFLMAAGAFLALFVFRTPFPYVVLGAGVLGGVRGFLIKKHALIENISTTTKPSNRRALQTLFTWLLIWALPVLIVFILFGKDSNFHHINLFFSKMAVITFGGAYAALSYVAQQGVEIFGWLQGQEMLDGLALAESTPGPLIQVVQYVGFIGAFRNPFPFDPISAALLGSILTTWMTFAPCFLFIFTLAPYIEFIRGQKILSDSLSAISSAVIGVILNLSIWFTVKTLFSDTLVFKNGLIHLELPRIETVDLLGLSICGITLILQFKFQRGLFTILGVGMSLGIVLKYISN